jgi:hypothetical protein
MTTSEFLTSLGLDQYQASFEENGIDVDVLVELEESDLKDLGVKLLGHRKKLMRAIRLMGPSSKEIAAGSAPEAAPEPTVQKTPAPKLKSTRPAGVTIQKTSQADPAPARRLRRPEMIETVVEKAKSKTAASDASPAKSKPTRRRSTTSQHIKKALNRIPPAAAATGKTKPPEKTKPAVVPDKKKVSSRKKKTAFSETQWFMAGAQKDAEILETQSDTSDYTHDESISEDERREYTLRKDDE